jgi:hypothetical protein
MPHVFQGFALFLPEARAAIAEAGRFLFERTPVKVDGDE